MRDGPALRISDFLSQREFHRLHLYQEFYRRFPVEHQAAVGLAWGPRLLSHVAARSNAGRARYSRRFAVCDEWRGPGTLR